MTRHAHDIQRRGDAKVAARLEQVEKKLELAVSGTVWQSYDSEDLHFLESVLRDIKTMKERYKGTA